MIKFWEWSDSAPYVNNSLHLARKYARIFVGGHYLFREANSLPRAKLEETYELRGTDNVQGQMSEHIFAPNEGYCLRFIILQIFFATRAALKIGEYSRIFPSFSFSWGIFGHVKSLDQSRESKKISWIIIMNIIQLKMNFTSSGSLTYCIRYPTKRWIYLKISFPLFNN